MYKEFKNPKQRTGRSHGFPDLLNYAAFVDSGTILLKDGSLLAGWHFAGPDLNSASAEELAALSHQVNAALAQLGDGWMMNVDLIRRVSVGYPNRGAFPDPTTELIDQERREHYQREGQHFETTYGMTLTYTPPTESQSRAARVFFKDD